jgi:hypothetical protein
MWGFPLPPFNKNLHTSFTIPITLLPFFDMSASTFTI